MSKVLWIMLLGTAVVLVIILSIFHAAHAGVQQTSATVSISCNADGSMNVRTSAMR